MTDPGPISFGQVDWGWKQTQTEPIRFSCRSTTSYFYGLLELRGFKGERKLVNAHLNRLSFSFSFACSPHLFLYLCFCLYIISFVLILYVSLPFSTGLHCARTLTWQIHTSCTSVSSVQATDRECLVSLNSNFNFQGKREWVVVRIKWVNVV